MTRDGDHAEPEFDDRTTVSQRSLLAERVAEVRRRTEVRGDEARALGEDGHQSTFASCPEACEVKARPSAAMSHAQKSLPSTSP